MKPSTPKGTRDFGPVEMQKRQYILGVLRRNFELFGYQPIETPAMENIGTLTGKYGDEGDQLIFKILNSRIHENKNKDTLRKEFELSLESSRNSAELTEKALRYDLTVPFARFVVMNQHNLTFPFKRYQIQPVWRADRPQKGRYREFYQCDADVIGSTSLVNELELISLIDKSFHELDVPIVLKFNNRKILNGIVDAAGLPIERLNEVVACIDSFDKMGQEVALNILAQREDITHKQVNDLWEIIKYLTIQGSTLDFFNRLKAVIKSEIGIKGIEEAEYLWRSCQKVFKGELLVTQGLLNKTMTYVPDLYNEAKKHYVNLEFDITLARGLNYYTGTIFEVKANAGSLSSSILGGGRYDDLTGIFGLPNMSGVGISFGIDRIYDVMEELNLFPEGIHHTSTTKVLFAHFDADTQQHCLQLATQLRQHNIACEVYPDLTKKMGKQFDYANKKNIPFVCTVGSNEMASGDYTLKNMASGQQEKLTLHSLIETLK